MIQSRTGPHYPLRGGSALQSLVSLPLKLFLAKMGVDFLIPGNPQLHVVPDVHVEGTRKCDTGRNKDTEDAIHV